MKGLRVCKEFPLNDGGISVRRSQNAPLPMMDGRTLLLQDPPPLLGPFLAEADQGLWAIDGKDWIPQSPAKAALIVACSHRAAPTGQRGVDDHPCLPGRALDPLHR